MAGEHPVIPLRRRVSDLVSRALNDMDSGRGYQHKTRALLFEDAQAHHELGVGYFAVNLDEGHAEGVLSGGEDDAFIRVS
ncbi:MAG: hypothetical protein WDA03_10730 [Trueperaceae bacterium]